MSAASQQALPRAAIQGLFALVLLALLLAAAGRAGWLGSATPSAVAAISEQELRFIDSGRGTVLVLEAGSGMQVTEIEVGDAGFVRSVMRGLARERKRSNLGSEAPFRFTHYADGRFSLSDPMTGRIIELRAFGPDNAGAFEALVHSASELRHLGQR